MAGAQPASAQIALECRRRVLQPRGPAVRVRFGDVLHFAQLRFVFLDAGAAWDALRAR